MKYFTISELCASATAQREGIDNRPPTSAYHLLHVLVDQLLDPIREAWGEPIVVSSGYRCKELNALVGGAKNSHHLLGCAADLIAGNKADHRRLFNLIQQMQQEGRIKFTQLIWGGAKEAPLATATRYDSVACDERNFSSSEERASAPLDLSSQPLGRWPEGEKQRSVACDSDGRWIHISYVPSDLRCQVIDYTRDVTRRS